MARTRVEYLALRRAFEPTEVTLAIVAESPPKSGKYFYDTSGRVSEPLFSALMGQVGEMPATKEEGLLAVRDRGWVLVDATYEPVNGLSPRERDAVIVRDRSLLFADLEGLASGRATAVVLLKANVCRLLEPLLQQAGFNVLNGGRAVYFPAAGQQGRFREQFGAIVGEAGLLERRHHGPAGQSRG